VIPPGHRAPSVERVSAVGADNPVIARDRLTD